MELKPDVEMDALECDARSLSSDFIVRRGEVLALIARLRAAEVVCEVASRLFGSVCACDEQSACVNAAVRAALAAWRATREQS